MSHSVSAAESRPESLSAEFLHALLHDLKGPVGRLRILSKLLVRRISSEDSEVRTLVEQLGASADTAEIVLEGVRRYAEALDRPYHPSRFDLTLSLNSALNILAPSIRASGARVTHGLLPEVRGDIVQLSVLFQELIANSLRFRSSDPPSIQIAAPEDDPAYWTITVTDNGAGIPATAMGRLFRPLGKASPDAGAGMGLAICRRIVLIHGGEIAAKPQPRGTEIRVLLPR